MRNAKSNIVGVRYSRHLICYAAFLLFSFSCSPFSDLLFPDIVSAEDAKEQYQKLQKEMETRRQRLEQAKKRERSVLEDLDHVGRSLTTIEAELRKQHQRMRQTESEIRRVEHEISVIEEELEKERAWLKRRLQAMQRYGQSGDILFLLAATDDLAALVRRWKYLERIAMKDRKVIEEFAENLRSLDRKEKQLQGLRAELKKSQERLKPIEASLSDSKRDKEFILASVRKEKASHEKLLKELQEASKRLLDVLRKLEEKDTYEAKGFSGLRGHLIWPVNGKVAIPYGSQRDPKFNTPVFRNGIYIKSDEDSVKAVYAGKVVFADWFKGYGNLVIINHGEGYHTLYGNLSETFLKVGDIIKIKDAVGKVGESGIVNAPSLYFEVRYKGKPLDPMQWLKRK